MDSCPECAEAQPVINQFGTPGTARYGWRYGCHINDTQCLSALVRWYGSSTPRATPHPVQSLEFGVRHPMFSFPALNPQHSNAFNAN